MDRKQQYIFLKSPREAIAYQFALREATFPQDGDYYAGVPALTIISLLRSIRIPEGTVALIEFGSPSSAESAYKLIEIYITT